MAYHKLFKNDKPQALLLPWQENSAMTLSGSKLPQGIILNPNNRSLFLHLSSHSITAPQILTRGFQAYSMRAVVCVIESDEA